MSYLLDTNVLSELRKGPRANGSLREWYAGIAEDEIHLSVLVLGELRRGIESIRRRDGSQADVLDAWLRGLSRRHADRFLSVDTAVAEEWGRLTAKRPGSAIDTLMAATALVHDLVLVTRNTRDVAWTGVRHRDPFVPSP